MLNFIADAARHVLRNPWALALYIGASILVGWLRHGGQYYLEANDWRETFPVAGMALRFGVDLVSILTSAAVQSIVFAVLGRELSRPLWKVSVPGEALRRFFTLWFILALVIVLSRNVTIQLMADNSPFAGMMITLSIVVVVSYIPFGAALMHHGRAQVQDIGAALAPYGRDLARLLILLAIAFFQFLFFQFLQMEQAAQNEHDFAWIWQVPVLYSVSGFIGCVIFCAAWIICMTQTETADDDDLDF